MGEPRAKQAFRWAANGRTPLNPNHKAPHGRCRSIGIRRRSLRGWMWVKGTSKHPRGVWLTRPPPIPPNSQTRLSRVGRLKIGIIEFECANGRLIEEAKGREHFCLCLFSFLLLSVLSVLPVARCWGCDSLLLVLFFFPIVLAVPPPLTPPSPPPNSPPGSPHHIPKPTPLPPFLPQSVAVIPAERRKRVPWPLGARGGRGGGATAPPAAADRGPILGDACVGVVGGGGVVEGCVCVCVRGHGEVLCRCVYIICTHDSTTFPQPTNAPLFLHIDHHTNSPAPGAAPAAARRGLFGWLALVARQRLLLGLLWSLFCVCGWSVFGD